mgnify:FL=1
MYMCINMMYNVQEDRREGHTFLQQQNGRLPVLLYKTSLKLPVQIH